MGEHGFNTFHSTAQFVNDFRLPMDLLEEIVRLAFIAGINGN